MPIELDIKMKKLRFGEVDSVSKATPHGKQQVQL